MTAADNPLLEAWTDALRPAALRPDQAGAFPAGLRCRHGGAEGGGRGDRRRPGRRRPSTTPSPRWSGAGCTLGPGRRGLLRPRRRRHQRRDSRRSSATWRRCSSRHCDEIFLNGRCSRGSTRSASARDVARPRRRAEARARPLPHHLRPRRRRARRRRQDAARRDQRAARRRSARSSARTCSPTRAPRRWCSTARPISPACPTSLRRRRGRGGARSAACRASTSSPCRARRIEPFLQFSTRRDLREKAFEAWIKRGENGGDDRQPRASSPRWSRSAPSARKLLGYRDLRPFPPRRHDGEDAGGGRATCSTTVWEPARARGRARGRRTLQALVAAEGGNFRARAVGLAPLCREACASARSISTRPS